MRPTIKARPMMPPTTPPAMAPVLELELEDEFEDEPEDEVAASAAELAASVWMADVGVGTPLVKGSLLALVAPGNASSVVAVLGATVVLEGLSTRSMTCITPFLTSTLGRMIRALFA